MQDDPTVQDPSWKHRTPGFTLSTAEIGWVLCLVPVILAFERWKQNDQEFKLILTYKTVQGQPALPATLP